MKITPKRYVGESVVVSARFPRDMLRELDNIASETGRSRNEIMTLCMEFALEHLKIEDKK